MEQETNLYRPSAQEDQSNQERVTLWEESDSLPEEISCQDWHKIPPAIQENLILWKRQAQTMAARADWLTTRASPWPKLKPWLRGLIPLWAVLALWLGAWAQRVVSNDPELVPKWSQWVVAPFAKLELVQSAGQPQPTGRFTDLWAQLPKLGRTWTHPHPEEKDIGPGVALWVLALCWVILGMIFWRLLGRDDVDWLRDGPYRKTAIPWWLETLGLVVVMGLAVYFRGRYVQAPFPRQNPPGLNHDAAWSCIFANDVAQGMHNGFQRPSGRPFYEPFAQTGAHGETLYFYWEAVFIYFLGSGRRAVEWCSVTTGCLTVLAFYFMVRCLFSIRLALISSLILATCGYHVVYSWTSWRAITLPLAWCLAAWALFAALKQKQRLWPEQPLVPPPETKRRWLAAVWRLVKLLLGWCLSLLLWALAGAMAAFLVNSYNSGRYAPLILVVFLPYALLPQWRLLISYLGVCGAFYLFFYKDYRLQLPVWVACWALAALPLLPDFFMAVESWWRGWRKLAHEHFLRWGRSTQIMLGIIVAVLVCWVCLWPLIDFAQKYPHYWQGRAEDLRLDNQMRRAGQPGTAQYYEPLLYNLMTAPLIYNRRAGGDDWFVYEQLLLYPTAILYGLGLAYALVHFYRKPMLLLLMAHAYGMAINIATRPNGNRPFVGLPSVYVFAGLAVILMADALHLAFSGYRPARKRAIWRKGFVYLAMASLLAAHVVSNYYTWVDCDTRREVFGFYPDATVAAEFAQPYYANGYEVVFCAGNWPRDALTYLMYPGPGKPYPAFQNRDYDGRGVYQYAANGAELMRLLGNDLRKPTVVVIEKSDNWGTITELHKRFPTAPEFSLKCKAHPRHTFNRQDYAMGFVISASDIAGQRPTDGKFDPNAPAPIEEKINAFVGGEGTQGGQFRSPVGVAADTGGNLYVADMSNQRIQKIAPDGTFIKAWGRPGEQDDCFHDPEVVSIGQDGNVYVLDTWNHRVAVYTAEGVFTRIAAGGFYGPRGMTTAGGRLYIADSGHGVIQSFNLDGSGQKIIGKKGKGPGELDEIVGLAVRSDGTVMVADTSNDRLAKYGPNGEFQGNFPVPGWNDQHLKEAYMVADKDRIYLANPNQGRIEIFNWDGRHLGALAEGLVRPTALAITGGRMIVTERDANRLKAIPLPK